MKKHKTGLWVLLIAALILFGDLLYWTHSIGLGSRLPAMNWGQAQLWHGNNTFAIAEIPLEEGDYGRIAAALETERVTNRPKFSTISQPYFYLVLYGPAGATGVTVVENGDVAVNLPDGSTRCYDGGQELYQTLSALK